MGLFDSIEQQVGGSLLGKLTGQQQGGMMQAVAGLISGNGGLSGITNLLTQKGLGQQVQSWISNNPNMPIEAQHVEQAFGADKIQAIAKQMGVDPSHVSGGIAQILPEMINKMTPQGTMVPDAQAESGLSGLMSKGLAGLFGK